ncbi:MAG: hypothetical protein IPO36_21595 [Anaerolineales bacterium]|nr:hypothetical protein [Anaerolineales bacterium]
MNTLAIYKANNLRITAAVSMPRMRQPVLMKSTEIRSRSWAAMENAKEISKAGVASHGPALCDYDFLERSDAGVEAQGYNVIFTFQHEECCYSPRAVLYP